MRVYRKIIHNLIITAECHYVLILVNNERMNMSDTVTHSHEAYLHLFVSWAWDGDRLSQSKEYRWNRHRAEVPVQLQILEPTQMLPKAVTDFRGSLA